MSYVIRMASVCLDKRPLRRDDLRYPALSRAPGRGLLEGCVRANVLIKQIGLKGALYYTAIDPQGRTGSSR